VNECEDAHRILYRHLPHLMRKLAKVQRDRHDGALDVVAL
jgi:hypothetical protein